MAPSLCGTFLTDKRSLVAFTWTITTVFTLVAFVSALIVMIHVHTHYKRLEYYYENDWKYEQQQQQRNNDDGEGGEGGAEQNNSADWERQIEEFLLLSQMSSSSMTFVALYTMAMAIALSLYGSTAIVGFTSLRGVYIGPCFSQGSRRLQLGIFGGAIVFFANLLLVCAVIFGEVRVEDWRENRENEEGERDKDQREPYEIERIATILCVTCMFLSALYTVFAILLFLYFGSDESTDDAEVDSGVQMGPKPLRSISNDPRRENFITMGEAT